MPSLPSPLPPALALLMHAPPSAAAPLHLTLERLTDLPHTTPRECVIASPGAQCTAYRYRILTTGRRVVVAEGFVPAAQKNNGRAGFVAYFSKPEFDAQVRVVLEGHPASGFVMLRWQHGRDHRELHVMPASGRVSMATPDHSSVCVEVEFTHTTTAP